ncbi:EamA-like transporter family protein [compost metagenome]
MGRYLLGTMQYETVTSLRFMLALPLLLVITVSQGAPWQLNGGLGTSALISLNLLLQALLPGLLSMLLYYRGLSTTKASFATLAELSFPMTSLVLNWAVYGQLVTWAQLLGFVLIWTALFAISAQQKEQAEPAAQVELRKIS